MLASQGGKWLECLSMHYSAQSFEHDLVSEQKSVLDRASMDAVRDVTLSRRTIEHIHSLLRELAMATMTP